MGELFRELRESGVIEAVTRNCSVAYGRAESTEKILSLGSGPRRQWSG
jgi:hypothetical protein